MSRVALSSIPTIRQLYGSSVLNAAGKQARYVPDEKLLDRVSLMSVTVLKDLAGIADLLTSGHFHLPCIVKVISQNSKLMQLSMQRINLYLVGAKS